jgi:hypothetical protein
MLLMRRHFIFSMSKTSIILVRVICGSPQIQPLLGVKDVVPSSFLRAPHHEPDPGSPISLTVQISWPIRDYDHVLRHLGSFNREYSHSNTVKVIFGQRHDKVHADRRYGPVDW